MLRISLESPRSCAQEPQSEMWGRSYKVDDLFYKQHFTLMNLPFHMKLFQKTQTKRVRTDYTNQNQSMSTVFECDPCFQNYPAEKKKWFPMDNGYRVKTPKEAVQSYIHPFSQRSENQPKRQFWAPNRVQSKLPQFNPMLKTKNTTWDVPFFRKAQRIPNQGISPSLQVSQFKKIKLLGTGKSGRVFLVKHQKTGFILAMKVIEKHTLLNQQPKVAQKGLKQLLQEIKIQFYLQHKNIIQLYGCFADTLNIYFLMELGAGGQLFKFMKKGSYHEEEDSSFITKELLEGLDYLHQKGILHRDLKPQNIVLIHGIPKICDFGCSIYCPDEVRKTLCGTPLYLSPEILVSGEYNYKTDIWAVGIILYELIYSDNPFRIRKGNQLDRILSEDLTISKGSPEFKSFIKFILRKDPTKRPDTSILLQHPFIKKYEQLETSKTFCS